MISLYEKKIIYIKIQMRQTNIAHRIMPNQTKKEEETRKCQ